MMMLNTGWVLDTVGLLLRSWSLFREKLKWTWRARRREGGQRGKVERKGAKEGDV